MAGHFRKRRRFPGPAKNTLKVERGREEELRSRRAGSLGERFPAVERLVVTLEFLTPQQHILGQETRTFLPADILDFSAPCPGKCGTGSFDLAAKIEDVVAARGSDVRTGGVCRVRLYAGLPDECGCEFKSRLQVSYLPEAESSEPGPQQETPSA